MVFVIFYLCWFLQGNVNILHFRWTDVGGQQHLDSMDSKNDIRLVCSNFNKRKPISIIFWQKWYWKIGNQTLIYFLTSPNWCCVFTGKTRKYKYRIFSLRRCTAALPEFNQLLLDFFNVADLRPHIHAAVDSLNIAINWVQLWDVGSHSSEKTKLRASRCRDWTVLRALADALRWWKKKIVIHNEVDSS